MSYYIDTLLIHSSSKLTKQLIMAMVVIFLVFVLLSPNLVSAYAGLGGYISEKLLGSSGGTSASLYLGDSSDGPVVLGSGPIISTLPSSGSVVSGGTTAMLQGNLANLNGMPQADVWFVWGYSSSTMTNITPAITVLAIGNQTAIITGFNSEQEVFYQFQSSTDGTSLGSVMSFRLAGGMGGWLLWNILTLVIAFVLFIFILRMSSNPIAALIGAIVAIIAISIVRGALQAM